MGTIVNYQHMEIDAEFIDKVTGVHEYEMKI
jgi:hypothetical protein